MTSLLRKRVGEDVFMKWKADPVAFVRSFDRSPWPYQADIIRQVLARVDGQFSARVAVISMPRQNGKSTLSAWMALWRLFVDEGDQEIVSVALDRSSAGIILGDARRIISRSSILFDQLDRHGLTRDEIRLKDGRRWLIKPADAAYSRGLRPSMICYDELGWAVDRELFDVLSSAQAAQPDPLMIITSTVGPIKAGVLWDLFESSRAGDPSIQLIYTNENQSPKITQQYLDRQRSLLPATVFAREHLNQWSEGGDAFCSESDWKTALGDGSPLRNKDAGPSWIFVDLGWSHDETAIATVVRQGDERVIVRSLDTFQGSQSQPVEFRAVEQKLRDLAKKFNAKKIIIESPQGVASAQSLNRAGLDVEILYPTARSNSDHWGALYSALKAGQIHLPDDARLRRQLLTLTIKSTANGWRVEDIPSIHQDRCVAIAGACYAALNSQTGSVSWLAYPESGDGDGDDMHYDWQRGWVKKNKYHRHSKGATGYMDCTHRAPGCDQCDEELAESRYFERQQEAEAAITPMSQEEFDQWHDSLGGKNIPPTQEEIAGEMLWRMITKDVKNKTR